MERQSKDSFYDPIEDCLNLIMKPIAPIRPPRDTTRPKTNAMRKWSNIASRMFPSVPKTQLVKMDLKMMIEKWPKRCKGIQNAELKFIRHIYWNTNDILTPRECYMLWQEDQRHKSTYEKNFKAKTNLQYKLNEANAKLRKKEEREEAVNALKSANKTLCEELLKQHKY